MAHAFRSSALALLTLAIGVLPGCGSEESGEKIGQSSAAITHSNDKAGYDFFVAKGLTGAQSAGIIGNLDVESGMDPTAVQSGGPGRGLAQWLVGGRWDTTSGDNVQDYASMKGADADSLNLQLDFIWFELTNFSDYGLADLRAATSVDDAVYAFQSRFEGCSACDQSARDSNAQSVYAAYSDDPLVDGGSGDDDTADSSNTCTLPTGEVGACLDTGTCTTLGGTSTSGLCPGADNIQCCTQVDSGSSVNSGGGSSGGMTTGGSGSTSGGTTSGTKKTDGGSSADDDASSSGGCAISQSGSGAPSNTRSDFAWLAAVGLVMTRARRRNVRTS